MDSVDPWRCKFCMRMVSSSSAYCGGCWGHWSLCQDATYVHKKKKKDQQGYTPDWQETPWESPQDTWSPRRRSPRKRTQSPRKRSVSARARHQQDQPDLMHGHQGGKGQEKGKGFEKGGAVAFGHLPPSTQWLSPPAVPFATDSSTAPQLTPGTSSTPSTAMQPFGKSKMDKEDPTQELQELRQLHAEVKKGEQTEEIKKAVAIVEAMTRKEDAKSYKQLVSLLDKARKKLSDIDEQWEAFRSQWSTYLDNAMKMWTAHIDSYEEGENKFAEKRAEAAAHLQQVRTQLHEVHIRTMQGSGTIPQGELQEGQTALDETMSIEDMDTVAEPHFNQLKEELKGVVQRVKDTIEDKMSKRSLSVRQQEGEEAQIVEPADKKARDSQ